MSIRDTMMKRILEQRRKKPLTMKQVNAIVDAQMKESGYATKGGAITNKGIKRGELTIVQRRKDRLAKQLSRPINQIAYYGGKPVVKNMYKFT